MKGQRNEVVSHLNSFGAITSKEAFEMYGITRLAAIIHDLRIMGYNIETDMIVGKTRYGSTCQYARYVLVEE